MYVVAPSCIIYAHLLCLTFEWWSCESLVIAYLEVHFVLRLSPPQLLYISLKHSESVALFVPSDTRVPHHFELRMSYIDCDFDSYLPNGIPFAEGSIAMHSSEM